MGEMLRVHVRKTLRAKDEEQREPQGGNSHTDERKGPSSAALSPFSAGDGALFSVRKSVQFWTELQFPCGIPSKNEKAVAIRNG
jgi:hypothetical protein